MWLLDRFVIAADVSEAFDEDDEGSEDGKHDPGEANHADPHNGNHRPERD
jgi:hypothetical protein